MHDKMFGLEVHRIYVCRRTRTDNAYGCMSRITAPISITFSCLYLFGRPYLFNTERTFTSDRIRVGAALFHGIPLYPCSYFIREVFTHVIDVYCELVRACASSQYKFSLSDEDVGN